MANNTDHARTSAARTLSIEYAESKKPLSSFPGMLVAYLVRRFGLKGRVLDVMCGRGEHMLAFHRLGLEAWGADISPSAGSAFEEKGRVRLCNLADDRLPFEDGSFDVVFCKSAIEHVNPDHLFSEFSRVLRPGGRLIALTPDWYYTYRYFYIDHTHGYGVPFTKSSLSGILPAWGFRNVACENICYIPSSWAPGLRGRISRFACRAVRLLPYPYDYFSIRNGRISKFVRFANEVQVLGVGEKLPDHDVS